jgi:uncharacterized membrane protein YbhN (UPF0104 family)
MQKAYASESSRRKQPWMSWRDRLAAVNGTLDRRVDWRLRVVASLLLAAGIVAAMVLYIDTDRFLDAIRRADWLLLGCGAGVHFLSWGVRTVRYERILASLDVDVSLPFLLGIVTVSQIGNVLLPARSGDAVRVSLLERSRSLPYATGFASVTTERLVDLLAVVVTGTVGVAGLVVFADIPSLSSLVPFQQSVFTVLSVGIVGASGLALALVGLRLAGGDGGHGPVLTRLLQGVGAYVADIRRTFADRGSVLVVLGISVVVWTLDAATALLVVVAMGVTAPPLVLGATVLTGVSLGAVAKTIPVAPGGIGAYEGAFAAVLVLATGTAGGLGLSIAIVDHLVKNLVAMGIGLVGLVVLNVSLGEPVEARDGTDSGCGDSVD